MVGEAMNAIHILLVDDEHEFTVTLEKILRRRGHRTVIRESGDAALETIGNEMFDVIVLDVKMPGTNGLDVLKIVRQKIPNTEVILMTGHLSVSDEEEGFKLGAFAYLVKPHPIKDLIEKIELAASKSRLRMKKNQKESE